MQVSVMTAARPAVTVADAGCEHGSSRCTLASMQVLA
jgi:hypothetical protein